jgi:CDP-3, 6-dideoxy-D-glycero-L-glycero-4-hexulose-4-reductase
MKSILLTGAKGTLAKSFINMYSGDYDITSAVRHPQSADEVKFNGWEDISSEIKADLVIHFAGKYLVEESINSQHQVNDAVIGSAASILDYCVSTSTPLIALGSYFEKAPSADYPWSHYAIAKEAAKNLIKLASDNHGVTIRYLYTYDTYGRDISRGKIVDVLLSEKTKKLDLSPGEQRMNLTHEQDLSSAINLVVTEIMNGSSGYREHQIKNEFDEYTLKEIVEIVNSKRTNKIDVKFGAKPYRKREAFSVWDCAPAVPNWKPNYNFVSFVENYLKDKNAE